MATAAPTPKPPLRGFPLFLENLKVLFKKLLIVLFVLVVGVTCINITIENWESGSCWVNDHVWGSLTRDSAKYKLNEQKNSGIVVTEVTGITDLGENLKRVEYKYHYNYKDLPPDAKDFDGKTNFRKYDDGWRIEPDR